MIYPVPTREQAKKQAGGMPDIPLVCFSVGTDGSFADLPSPISEGILELVERDGISFFGRDGKLLLLWGTPSIVAGNIKRAVERRTGAVTMFGCRAGKSPRLVPPDFDLHPFGIAFRMGGQTHRVSGAAGIASLKGLCLHMTRLGMGSPNLKENIKRLLVKNLSGTMPYLAYRRAEMEMASV